MAHVGQEIRRMREERGLNQAQLAVSVGTGPAAISRIENGRQSPNTETLARIARALDVEVADLFPKGQSPLPFESEERRQAALENFVAFVDSLDDEQLARFRELYREERIGLALAHHKHSDDPDIRAQFARAVEKLMAVNLKLHARGYGHVEESGRKRAAVPSEQK